MKKNNHIAAYTQLYKAFCETEEMPYAEWEWFMESSEIVRLQQGEFLVAPHHLSIYAYFIVKGVVVGYRECRNEMFVHWIRSTNDYVLSNDRCRIELNKEIQLAGEVIVAAEETIAIRIKYYDLKWLKDHSASFSNRIERYLGQFFMQFLELDDIVILSPEERYEKIQRSMHFDLEIVPDVYLASYLALSLEELKVVKKLRKRVK